MHRFLKYESANSYPAGDPRHADVAVCTCGWKSAPEEESNDFQLGYLKRAFEAHQTAAHKAEGIK